MQLNQILEERQQRISSGERSRFFAASVAGHAVAVAAFVLLPILMQKPPQPIDYVAVTVVPPKALGVEEPPPPTPEEPKESQPAPPPPPPPKKEEPKKVEPERPVLKKKETPKPPPPKPPPPKPKPAVKKSPLAPPSSPLARPPQRKGSPQGNPLGASTAEATLGVEDPNFTYGYYLDRVVAMISENWTRPPVGGEATDAVLYFRILRNGKLELLSLKRTSGNETFDRTALAAVRATEPLPPLPKGYKRDYLGINLIVK